MIWNGSMYNSKLSLASFSNQDRGQNYSYGNWRARWKKRVYLSILLKIKKNVQKLLIYCNKIVYRTTNITNLCRICTSPKEFDKFLLEKSKLLSCSVLWLYIPDCFSFKTAWNISYNYSVRCYYHACWLWKYATAILQTRATS